MAQKKRTAPRKAEPRNESPTLRAEIERMIVSKLGNDYRPPRVDTYYNGLAYAVRKRLIEKWINAQRDYYATEAKRVYYLSMEFLPGPFMRSYILSLGMEEECREALKDTGFTLEMLEEQEHDPGLGNGGLGRLASCFMDSLACLNIPSYGYGIRYDYGIFRQQIVDGAQVEECDNWLRGGNPWEIARRNFLYTVRFWGRSETYETPGGGLRHRWVDTENVGAMACDILIPGYGTETVSNMRLWAAMSSSEFKLDYYHHGNYMKAMEDKVLSENISKVLYPSDEAEQGRELRLKQQYFLVAATFQDIIRRFRKSHSSFGSLPDAVAVQLNDTHPSIGIPELMRILMDEEGLGWDEAWDICVRTFAYTNHTVLPEALETWPLSLLGRLLPRHMEIILEINRRFLEDVARRHPGDEGKLRRMSLIEEGAEKRVRMAHLAVVGSHSVNGVAALHTRILTSRIFGEFNGFFPGRFRNITNGITQRRWLLQANPNLSDLITRTIGEGWAVNLEEIKALIPYAEDPVFRAAWREVKAANKKRLAAHILKSTAVAVDPGSLFDVQAKRIHEYKRQLLNVLHVVAQYNRLRRDPGAEAVPRTVIFSGKAAPGYLLAKLTIKLISDVAQAINADRSVRDLLKVVFVPNYCVSEAERLISAADLSEQISTAGMEASGTGNMKFALNGALTIGTLDGANIEIAEEVGEGNAFIFGLRCDEVERLKAGGYNPYDYYGGVPELREAIDMIGAGAFSPGRPSLFAPIRRALLEDGDRFMVLADYEAYATAQEEASRVFKDREEWTRRSILNTANMGKFSSDRAVSEYARDIWNL